jgi:hypothetical protein
MPRSLAFMVVVVALPLASCGEPLGRLPAIAHQASTTGGSNSLCEPGALPGSTPETASHSPEIVARLRRRFPPGSPAPVLRSYFKQQDFELYEGCSPDRSISLATFRQRGGNGITSFPAFVAVYWKGDGAARIVWTTGDVAYTGL